MSVSSSLQHRIKTHGADPDDSGDDWEIGVGNLIIDLDADLEKDRQRLEMNRVLSVKSAAEGREQELEYNCAGAGAVFDGLQPFLCKEPKKFKLKRRNSATDAPEIVSGIPKVCVGKRREAQGRGAEMNSAPAAVDSSPDARSRAAKDAKKGKSQSKGVRREKDAAARTRKEKHGDEFESGAESLISRGGMDAAIVEHIDDTNTVSARLSFRRLHVAKTSRIMTRESELMADSVFVCLRTKPPHTPKGASLCFLRILKSSIRRFYFAISSFFCLSAISFVNACSACENRHVCCYWKPEQHNSLCLFWTKTHWLV